MCPHVGGSVPRLRCERSRAAERQSGPRSLRKAPSTAFVCLPCFWEEPGSAEGQGAGVVRKCPGCRGLCSEGKLGRAGRRDPPVWGPMSGLGHNRNGAQGAPRPQLRSIPCSEPPTEPGVSSTLSVRGSCSLLWARERGVGVCVCSLGSLHVLLPRVWPPASSPWDAGGAARLMGPGSVSGRGQQQARRWTEPSCSCWP